MKSVENFNKGNRQKPRVWRSVGNGNNQSKRTKQGGNGEVKDSVTQEDASSQKVQET